MRRPKQAQPTRANPVQASERETARQKSNANLRTPAPSKKGVPVKRYTIEETTQQMAVVEAALIQGLSEREIRVALTKQTPPHFVGPMRLRTLKARVHEQMKLEGERTRPMTREKQLRRLYAELADARGKNDPVTGAIIRKPHWAAVTRLEMLIAQVEGNFEPIKLDIDVVHREALTNVLTSITPDIAMQLIESYDKLATLAAHAAHATGQKMPALLPAPAKHESTVFTAGASSAAE